MPWLAWQGPPAVVVPYRLPAVSSVNAACRLGAVVAAIEIDERGERTAVGGHSEDRAIAALTVGVSGAIEVPIHALHQPGIGIQAVLEDKITEGVQRGQGAIRGYA